MSTHFFASSPPDQAMKSQRPLYELQAVLGFGLSGRGVDVSNSRVIEGVVTVVTPAAIQLLMQLVLFFGTLFFFIIGRDEFRKYALNWFASREARLRALKA